MLCVTSRALAGKGGKGRRSNYFQYNASYEEADVSCVGYMHNMAVTCVPLTTLLSNLTISSCNPSLCPLSCPAACPAEVESSQQGAVLRSGLRGVKEVLCHTKTLDAILVALENDYHAGRSALSRREPSVAIICFVIGLGGGCEAQDPASGHMAEEPAIVRW